MLFRIIGRLLSILELNDGIEAELYYSEEKNAVKMKFTRNDLSRKLMTLGPLYGTIVDISGEYDRGFYIIEELKIIDKDTPIEPLKYDDCEQFIIKCVCGHIMDSRIFTGKCTKCGQTLNIN